MSMSFPVIRCLSVAAALAFSSGMAAAQQPRLTKLDAVGEVMASRANQMGDTLHFDACSVYMRADSPVAMMADILPGVRRWLDRPVDRPCDHARRGGPWTSGVIVDSITTTDSLVYVDVTVTRGEWRYRERHVLPVLHGKFGWREARVFGGRQSHALPPRRKPGSPD